MLTLTPNPISLSAGAKIAVSATGSVDAPSTPQEPVRYAATSGASPSGGDVCKGASSAALIVRSEQRLVYGQNGRIGCRVPAQEHSFGYATGQGLKFGFHFIAGAVEILVNGAKQAQVQVSTGDTAELQITGGGVLWSVNGQTKYSLGMVATDCEYRAAAVLITPNTCLTGATWTADAVQQGQIGAGCYSWTATGGSITGSGPTITYTAPLTSGIYELRLNVPGAGEVTAAVSVGTLRLAAQACGSTVISGTVVEFAGNGGDGAVLEATGGTVLDNHHWLAPNAPGVYTLTLRHGGAVDTCVVNVALPLRVVDVEAGEYERGIAPGGSVQFVANCPGAKFSSPDWPEAINSAGYFYALDSATNERFGARTAQIRVTGCEQVLDFRVRVAAYFPTPDTGFAEPDKWVQLAPEFRTIETETDAGGAEYLLLNSVPTRRWKLMYKGLDHTNEMDGGASRLDRFFELVRGRADGFWYRDREGNLWEGCHFVSYGRDHNIYDTDQTRDIELVWRGTVDITGPQERGGV